MVEAHLPSRVMRQFGMFQAKPTNILMDEDTHKYLHKIDGRSGVQDWRQTHATYVGKWRDRLTDDVTGFFCGDDSYKPSDEYMAWFLPRTVYFVQDPTRQTGTSTRDGNLGGRFEVMVRIYCVIYFYTFITLYNLDCCIKL